MQLEHFSVHKMFQFFPFYVELEEKIYSIFSFPL